MTWFLCPSSQYSAEHKLKVSAFPPCNSENVVGTEFEGNSAGKYLRWNIFVEHFSHVNLLLVWYIPVTRTRYSFYIMSWGFFKLINKPQYKPAEQKQKTKRPCLTGAASLVRSIDKSHILISSKVLSYDKITMKKNCLRLSAQLAFFSKSYSLLPIRIHFYFFKDTCQVW